LADVGSLPAAEEDHNKQRFIASGVRRSSMLNQDNTCQGPALTSPLSSEKLLAQ